MGFVEFNYIARQFNCLSSLMRLNDSVERIVSAYISPYLLQLTDPDPIPPRQVAQKGISNAYSTRQLAKLPCESGEKKRNHPNLLLDRLNASNYIIFNNIAKMEMD